MSAPDSKIEAAFKARLEVFPDLPSVAWPNDTYTPTVGETYLEAFLLQGEPFQAELGSNGANRHVGIYQVSIYAPKGGGNGDVNALRDSLVDHFKRGTDLAADGITVRVIKAYASAMITESTRVHIPITVRYRTDVEN